VLGPARRVMPIAQMSWLDPEGFPREIARVLDAAQRLSEAGFDRIHCRPPPSRPLSSIVTKARKV
jgi:hypothetical protein